MSYLFSPIVYWVPAGGGPSRGELGFPYPANALEFLGQSTLDMASFCARFAYHSAPFAAVGVACLSRPQDRIRKLAEDYRATGVAVVAVLVPLVVLALLCRYAGRSTNVHYREFHSVYRAATKSWNRSNKNRLSSYDFTFSDWPTEFAAGASQQQGRPRDGRFFVTYPGKLVVDLAMALFVLLWAAVSFVMADDPSSSSEDSPISWLTNPVSRFVMNGVTFVYFVVYKFGIHVVYFGSFNGSQHQLGPFYSKQRVELMTRRGGERFKLLTDDNNHVDAMFFDRRSRGGGGNGDLVVICCEGNCGFYECGINHTPLSMGFSVLAWNHPGFCCSSGEPYPSQEAHAVDCVMLFAVRRLGFPESNVVVFGWSIGGFTATWLAMNYPNINGLLLDATFDTMDGIASYHQPFPMFGVLFMPLLNSICYMNIAKQLRFYSGPVRLIRRTKDEVMTYRRALSTNRTNYVLRDLLIHRYPNLFSRPMSTSILSEFLDTKGDARDELLNTYDVSFGELQAYPTAAGYPTGLGAELDDEACLRLVLLLASAYMVDLNASHCSPMPETYFAWSYELP